jgi:hypothetical protein
LVSFYFCSEAAKIKTNQQHFVEPPKGDQQHKVGKLFDIDYSTEPEP